jgi:hypothetical protein
MEDAMYRGLHAHLSPKEETILRQIATDGLEPDELRVTDFAHLQVLGLIENYDGSWRLTEVGTARLIRC